jgi:hypothetical protein
LAFAIAALCMPSPGFAQTLPDSRDPLPLAAFDSQAQPGDMPATPDATTAVPDGTATPAAAALPSEKATAVPPSASATEQFSIDVGTRVDVRMQNPAAPKQLGDIASSAEAKAVLSGEANPFLKWQVGFLGYYGPATASANGDATATTDATARAGSAAVLDLVAKLEFIDAVNVWIGRMPMPSNRASLSTEWQISPWTLPGRYGQYPLPAQVGPRLGDRDRDRGDGVALWGQIRGGRFKYYLGAFGLDQPKGASPLFTGRLSLSLLDPEPGYRTASFFGGRKRILSMGVFAQYRQGGSLSFATPAAPAADFGNLGGDLLLEVGNAHAGVLDVEAEIAKTWGDNEPVGYHFAALVSYLVPLEIGIGRFQPLVRVQHADGGRLPDAGPLTQLDAQLGFIVDGTAARLLLVYQYADLPGHIENALLFAVQLVSHVR